MALILFFDDYAFRPLAEYFTWVSIRSSSGPGSLELTTGVAAMFL